MCCARRGHAVRDRFVTFAYGRYRPETTGPPPTRYRLILSRGPDATNSPGQEWDGKTSSAARRALGSDCRRQGEDFPVCPASPPSAPSAPLLPPLPSPPSRWA
ncbi:hypothetical protein RHCRD62_50307 [Rhodococcus sp. RD6.2]|nr:hypothetical protein RHCRD62_50307 [Rhodococcus sp. RD6.2]